MPEKTPALDIHAEITRRIITAIEAGKAEGFRLPWNRGGTAGRPVNVQSGRGVGHRFFHACRAGNLRAGEIDGKLRKARPFATRLNVAGRDAAGTESRAQCGEEFIE